MTTDTHTLSPAAFSFLSDLTRSLADRATAPPQVRRAVAYLTAAADPTRAERLRPRAGEPAILVQRLAVWALHRVDDDVIGLAQCRLTDDVHTPELHQTLA